MLGNLLEPELCQPLKEKSARPNYTTAVQEAALCEKGRHRHSAGQVHPPQTQDRVVASMAPVPSHSEPPEMGRGPVSKL